MLHKTSIVEMSFRLKMSVLSLWALATLSACGDPQSYYEEAIIKKGYIPYTTPLASAGVGTIVNGGPESLRVATRPEKCFPNYIKKTPTNLRWVTETDLPSSYESFQLGFGADLGQILSAGNPLVSLNLGVNYVKNVQIQFQGASIEYLDEAALYYYYLGNMEEICRDMLEEAPFILQSLRIEKMKFNFFSATGVKVQLSPGMVGDIVNIGVGVNWSIQNQYDLVIDSPKYIGYQVGFMDSERPGRVGWYANKVKNGEFDFKDVGSSIPAPKVKSGAVDNYMR